MSLINPAPYGREAFERIYTISGADKVVDSVFTIKDVGVFAEEVDHFVDSLNWSYFCELNGADNPDPSTAPVLRFPFSANQLAAFMLSGWGYFLQAGLGEWADGPWQEKLDVFPTRGIRAKEAVIAAFQAYRDAEKVVGAVDKNPHFEVQRLLAEYQAIDARADISEKVNEADIAPAEKNRRIARVSAITAPAYAKLQAMRKTASDSENAWRKAMVLQLLSHRKERKVEYVSLESMVTPYLSKPFDSLPATVAARVREAFEPLFHWDEFGEQRRLQVVQEYDYKNDPAIEPVRAHRWNLVALIHDKENEIRNWELMPAPVPSEALIREQRLSVLRGELAALEAQSNAPYTATTVADAALPEPQAAPVLAESASSEASGATIHSTKTRRNTLTPVIETAQKDCRNSKDTAEVWAVLQTMAEKKVPPLLGATEDGLQYLRGGNAATFSRDALRKRLAR